MRRFWQLIILFSLIIPIAVFAQLTPSDISITSIPANPLPRQSVTIRIQSYAADLDQSMISWKYNGTLVGSGVGMTSISVIAPTDGNTGLIVATASGSGFNNSSVSLLLRPASVDLLWEAADAYVPPFYKGKALLPPNGLIRVTAIPAPTAPKGVVFRWSRDNSVVQDLSGYGKSSILFEQETLNQQEKVSVQAISGTFAGDGSITIVPQTPSVVAYKNEDGYINYAKGSTGTIETEEPGVVLHFEPFYFSVPGAIGGDLNIETRLGDEIVNTENNPTELRLARPDGGGTNTINLSISTDEYTLQNIKRTFTMIFR